MSGVCLEGPGTSPQDVQSHGTLSPSLSVDLLGLVKAEAGRQTYTLIGIQC